MTKRILILALFALMIVAALTACGDSGGDSGDGDRDFYEFEWYYYYDWQPIGGWGNDMVSKHWSEKFNINVIETKPDANSQEALNLRIAAEDYPDAIWMDRDHNRTNMGRMGILMPIDEMKEMVDNNWYDENIAASTQALYASQTDGVNYVIPNWPRQANIGVRGGITGGNNCWMYTKKVYEAVGSPVPTTLDDLFDYACMVRDAGLTNSGGAPIIPVLFDTDGNYGTVFMKTAMYLSFGGEFWEDSWYSIQPDGTISLALKNPAYREAILEGNRWYREGLIPETNFTDSREEFYAKLNSGRGGLIMHDHSQDDGYNFRRILQDSDPGNTIDIFTFPVGNEVLLYPPKEGIGLDANDVYHITYGSEGWNGSSIFRSAEKPERIFELFTWGLTLMGSVESMFGPPGPMWDELDENGYPILHTPESELSAEEYGNVIGGWKWTGMHGHANNVDNAKFAANAALPPEQQSWVVSAQANIFSPTMMMSDEFSAYASSIEPDEDLHIQRTAIADYLQSAIPNIYMAPTREAAEQIIDDAIAFAEANGLAEVSARYTAKWQENCNMQGGSAFGPPWPPAR